MSDSQPPIFFGGLPPRGGAQTTVATPVRPAPEDSDHGRDDQVDPGDRPRWNTLSIVSLAVSPFISIAGIICGIIAMKQIRATGERGGRLALGGMLVGGIGLALSIAIGAVVLFGGGALVAGVLGLPQGTSDSIFVREEALTPEEKAAAEAVVAAGGKSVEGHTVSVELCTAVNGFLAASGGVSTNPDASPEVLAAMETLAATASPNQAQYQAFLGLVKEPSSIPSIADAQAISADFTKAVEVDVVTCM